MGSRGPIFCFVDLIIDFNLYCSDLKGDQFFHEKHYLTSKELVFAGDASNLGAQSWATDKHFNKDSY